MTVSSSSVQEIVCVFGQPVAGNPTQYMMEKAFAAAGLEWRYLTFEVSPEGLPDAIRGMRAMGIHGGNLTIPHKVAVVSLLDGLTEAAELIGAVNCIFRTEKGLIGENTDGKGFLESLREVIDTVSQRVFMLGAGGAARAIAVELAKAGAARIDIANRSRERAEPLVALLRDRLKVAAEYFPWNDEIAVPAEAGILVQATSIGLNDPKSRVPIQRASLRSELVAADVVFNPPVTRFLSEAKSAGCKTLDGLGMIVNQAAIAFKIWTGRDPDKGVMREAVEEFLGV
jgi:shikimate dehydrogenase